MLRAIAIGVLIGAAAEAVAGAARLWAYRRPVYPLVNILIVFGTIMAAVATLGAHLGLAGIFGVGFAIGLVYEVANLAVLDWWYFPDDRLLMLRGKPACVVAISLAWGLVPVAIRVLGEGA